jgi:hypothetical protein
LNEQKILLKRLFLAVIEQKECIMQKLIIFFLVIMFCFSCSLDTGKVDNTSNQNADNAIITKSSAGTTRIITYSGANYTGQPRTYYPVPIEYISPVSYYISMSVPEFRSYICLGWPKGAKIRFYKNTYPSAGFFTTTIDSTGNEYIPDTKKIKGTSVSGGITIQYIMSPI